MSYFFNWGSCSIEELFIAYRICSLLTTYVWRKESIYLCSVPRDLLWGRVWRENLRRPVRFVVIKFDVIFYVLVIFTLFSYCFALPVKCCGFEIIFVLIQVPLLLSSVKRVFYNCCLKCNQIKIYFHIVTIVRGQNLPGTVLFLISTQSGYYTAVIICTGYRYLFKTILFTYSSRYILPHRTLL